MVHSVGRAGPTAAGRLSAQWLSRSRQSHGGSHQFTTAARHRANAQGVALGRSPLVRGLVKQGRLAAPFAGQTASARAYFVLTAAGALERAAVRRFIAWLEEVAKREKE